MFLVLKSLAGVDYPDGKGGVISIKGNCYLNQVTKAELDYLKKNFNFDKKIETGKVVVTDKADSQKQVEDTLQDSLNKQTTEISKNEAMNNVKIKQDKK